MEIWIVLFCCGDTLVASMLYNLCNIDHYIAYLTPFLSHVSTTQKYSQIIIVFGQILCLYLLKWWGHPPFMVGVMKL